MPFTDQKLSKPKWSPTNLMYSVMGGICSLFGLYFSYQALRIIYLSIRGPEIGFGGVVIIYFAPLAIIYCYHGWGLLFQKLRMSLLVLLLLITCITGYFALQDYLNDYSRGIDDLLWMTGFNLFLFVGVLFLYFDRRREEKAHLKV